MTDQVDDLYLTAPEVEALSQLIVELKYKDALPFINVLQRARNRARAEALRQDPAYTKAMEDVRKASITEAAMPVNGTAHEENDDGLTDRDRKLRELAAQTNGAH